MAVTPEELESIKEYVLKELPRVLEEDPQFALMIEGILSEKFPRRDEFTRLLDNLTALNLKQNEGILEMRSSFGRVDQRLDQVIADTRDFREEVAQDMYELREGPIQEIRGRSEALCEQMRDLRDWVQLIGGRLQTRFGRSVEDVVAGALKLGLSRRDIDPANVKLRQKIRDAEGLVFKPGKEKEVDIVAQNSELLVFEVKSSPKWDDVDDFAEKVELVRLQNPEKTVTGVLIVLGADEDLRAHCSKRGVILIP